MSYSESEPGSNSLSIFTSIFSKSESKSESKCDFNSIFINLGICVFFILCLHSFKKNLWMIFFIHSQNRINSYASNASIVHIFFWHIFT